ncbi:type IV pilus modification protein PilV [Agaribacterium sp. ZY112]|uniref:type IV pilus modification protein PilV n=1 Tax=Agaribacterium sp. ZY112 TaxID=3233574 RepID=UPI003524A80B
MLENRSFTGLKLQAGAGLIEVMVAVLVLGIGLLGLMNLQNRSLQLNQQAYLYSQASNLAWDIMERMGANSAVADSYLLDYGAAVTASTDCTSTNCSAEQLAQWDQAQWLIDLNKSLPLAEASITQAVGLREYTISIRMDVERKGEGELEQLDIGFRL